MKKVIVIGAGPAGLTAAYELLKANEGYSVTILEESDVCGGISRTVKYKNMRMDIGGHRFFSKDPRVNQWWEHMMPTQGALSMDDLILKRQRKVSPGGPDPEKTDRVMLLRDRVSRIYYQKKFFDYPISAKPQTFINMGLKQTVHAGFSYLGAATHKRPENSLEDFYINRFGKTLYSMFFEGYTEKLWGRHPREISADWGAQRVKGLSVTAVLRDMFGKLLPGQSSKKVETSLIEEFHYPKFGPGQLWELTADAVKEMGGDICFGCKVTGLQTEGDKITAVSYEKDGVLQTMEADAVLSSMPLKDLVAGMPQVPADIAAIASGLPYRDFVTVGLLVDRLNLKNETKIRTLGDIVPDCWIYVQDTNVKLGRIQIFNNWSPYMLPDPEKQVWIGLEYFCTEGDAFWNLSEKECSEQAILELIRMGILSSAGGVKDYHRERVKKAYPAYFDTYDEIDRLIAWLNTYENLYCIGRNGQHRYNNMDHSMATAFEAVFNIRHGVTDHANLWNVNTEKEYHEEK